MQIKNVYRKFSAALSGKKLLDISKTVRRKLTFRNRKTKFIAIVLYIILVTALVLLAPLVCDDSNEYGAVKLRLPKPSASVMLFETSPLIHSLKYDFTGEEDKEKRSPDFGKQLENRLQERVKQDIVRYIDVTFLKIAKECTNEDGITFFRLYAPIPFVVYCSPNGYINPNVKLSDGMVPYRFNKAQYYGSNKSLSVLIDKNRLRPAGLHWRLLMNLGEIFFVRKFACGDFYFDYYPKVGDIEYFKDAVDKHKLTLRVFFNNLKINSFPSSTIAYFRVEDIDDDGIQTIFETNKYNPDDVFITQKKENSERLVGSLVALELRGL